MAWKKGQSGNPSGEDKYVKEKRRLRLLAQSHCPKALERLVRMSETATDERTRLAANIAILDRGLGKPAQDVDVTSGGQSIAPILISNVIGNSDSSDK